MSLRPARPGGAVTPSRVPLRVILRLVVLTPMAPAIGLDAREIHVDARSEVVPADGSPIAPYRWLTDAVATVEPDEEVTIVLAAGDYTELSGETLPIEIELGQGAVILRGSGAGESRLRAGEAAAILAVSGASPDARFELHDLGLSGSGAGVSIVGGESQALAVAVRDCRFTDFKFQALEVVVGDFGRASVSVEGCAFSGGALYSLDLGTRWDSELVVDLRENRFDGVPLAAGGPFRSGAAIFVDERAEVRGTVSRNIFEDTANGLLLTTPEPWLHAATVSLDVIGNAFVGDADPAANGLVHGAYLALHEQHDVTLRWEHNTMAAGAGHALFFEQSVLESPALEWQDSISCDLFSVEAIANVFSGFGEGVVNLSVPFPDCVMFRDNGVEAPILDDEGIAAERGNFAIDADDLDPDAGYRPTATGRLVDRLVISRPAETRRSDLDGSCGETDGDRDGVFAVDIGAFESPGVCADDASLFVRGDCAENGSVDVTDPIHVLRYLFLGDANLTCRDACDSDDNGELEVSDAIYVLTFLFVGGKAPPAPYAAPGLDPTADEIRPICVDG